MGGGALTVVVGRKDRGIEKLEDLRGKKISVLAFQDTTYYALLGALAQYALIRALDWRSLETPLPFAFLRRGRLEHATVTPRERKS